jgi:hypothetical protein
MQASLFDGLSFDAFALDQDGWRPSELGVGGRDVFKALIIAVVVTSIEQLGHAAMTHNS